MENNMFQIKHVENSFEAIELCFKGEFDVIITDPPYSEHVQHNMCSGGLVGLQNVPKYQLFFDPLTQEDRAWMTHALYASKRWVISFCEVEALGIYNAMYPEEYIRSGIWYKPNSMGQLQKDRPAACYEGISVLHNKHYKKWWNGRGSYGMWKCNNTRGLSERHPNEKPIDLCLKLVALFSDRGETVFDPFCGSGAIGEACLALGRKYVGWDSSEMWVAQASERLANVTVGYARESDALKLCSMNTKEWE